MNRAISLCLWPRSACDIENAKIRLAPFIEKKAWWLIKDNFRHLAETSKRIGVTEIDGICYDLGVSSPQLDERERDFQERCATDMRGWIKGFPWQPMRS